jgi:His/Glu/Gln/Arg/opine family amino acid ABC transporter permease subunit
MFSYTNIPLILKGVATTLLLWILALVISFSLGTIIGVLQSGKIKVSSWLYLFLNIAMRLLRGVPFYLQLLIVYFVFPLLTGISLSSFWASVFSLGICSSAYVSQIICGGMQSYDESLWEMAAVLGYSKIQSVRYFVLPKVFRTTLLSLSGEVDQLIKTTSVCSTIGVLDLMGVTRNIIAREMNPVTMYISAAILFFALSTTWSAVVTLIQKRIRYVKA